MNKKLTSMSIEHFIHRRNLELLRDRLARTDGESECRRIVKLIEEEELKGFASLDDHAQRRGLVTLNNARKLFYPGNTNKPVRAT